MEKSLKVSTTIVNDCCLAPPYEQICSNTAMVRRFHCNKLNIMKKLFWKVNNDIVTKCQNFGKELPPNIGIWIDTLFNVKWVRFQLYKCIHGGIYLPTINHRSVNRWIYLLIFFLNYYYYYFVINHFGIYI